MRLWGRALRLRVDELRVGDRVRMHETRVGMAITAIRTGVRGLHLSYTNIETNLSGWIDLPVETLVDEVP